MGHFARVCRSKQTRQTTTANTGQVSANAIQVQPQLDNHIQLYNITEDQAEASRHARRPLQTQVKCQLMPFESSLSLDNHIQLYNITENQAEAAPTIKVYMSSSSGTRRVEVLPDSGVDISAAGQGILSMLGQYVDNLLPSKISPRAVNGSHMTPIGKLLVRIQLEGRSYNDDLHIYPGVTGALISWKAAKELGILPTYYPQPEQRQGTSTSQPRLQTTSSQTTTHSHVAEELMHEFSTVFDGEVTVMEGAKPFV